MPRNSTRSLHVIANANAHRDKALASRYNIRAGLVNVIAVISAAARAEIRQSFEPGI